MCPSLRQRTMAWTSLPRVREGEILPSAFCSSQILRELNEAHRREGGLRTHPRCSCPIDTLTGQSEEGLHVTGHSWPVKPSQSSSHFRISGPWEALTPPFSQAPLKATHITVRTSPCSAREDELTRSQLQTTGVPVLSRQKSFCCGHRFGDFGFLTSAS